MFSKESPAAQDRLRKPSAGWHSRWRAGLVGATAMVSAIMCAPAAAQEQPPNILVIMGDDVGTWNLSAYHRGMMGGSTPNLDRIAKEGALFTDYYAQQSCTAGRAAFILGQTPFRTGLLKVGLPAAKQGLQDKDPTIAELLKPLGYATGQIGKNHLGDRNEFLPTVHGFDEFYGILYHLNAMEEPFENDYPKDPAFRAQFGPRNILESKATDQDDATVDPRWGKVGKQTIVDSGPLPPHPGMDPAAKVSMETVEPELVRRSLDFIDRSVKDKKPFFLWHNSTRMHVWTHLSDQWDGKSGHGLYADGMMELDWEVGELLKKLDELNVADNTIVLFTSDNGPEVFTWPDGGNHPFRGEKGTTFEGGFRVPLVVRWPGAIKPGTIVNDIMAHEDWMPTLLAAAGDPDVKNKLLKGMEVGGKTFKNHLDGYNFLPYFKGEVTTSPRREVFYFTDSGELNALRYNDWKVSFKTVEGNLFNGHEATTNAPLVTNLRQDPWERYQSQSMMYGKWWGEKMWTFLPATTIVGQFLESFKEYPPSSPPSNFGVDKALAALEQGSRGAGK
ncbi:MAG: arylsulfatase [Mesorhizobium sp.]|nr:MAG: arylsulfatase [Mesorhizobium sp.]RWM43898.1 MAG: arylsulfatase [Mesorhizobium sp.]RWM53437.1 MAG: arylsulfatase [Mesorhizobium sp.]RWM56832.1 MAG: arylsulfatase [Mesorhizobium sp.]RWM96468.1 MAG: arylsulfatase [Mesorhizobium sp.]